MINLIWAMDKNNLIGSGDKIPWHVKEDLLYYKEKTQGKTVLMGEATYLSLKGYYKNKPLPYGTIFVASLTEGVVYEDATTINNVTNFLESCNVDLWVVGGATIYALALPYADNLYISFIKGNFKGDKYFPQIDPSMFKLVWKKDTSKVLFTIFERN